MPGQQSKPHSADAMFETQLEPVGQSPPEPQRQTGAGPLLSHHSLGPQHVLPQLGPWQVPVGAHDAPVGSAEHDGTV